MYVSYYFATVVTDMYERAQLYNKLAKEFLYYCYQAKEH